jgi:adenylosuccinate synthase
MQNQHTAVLGMQWGDEGKGKIVDHLAHDHQVIVRYQGGTNAGHTVVVGKKKFPLHLIPSGILYPEKTCVIGDGVVVNPLVLAEELEALDKRVGKRATLLIGSKAQLIMPWHIVRDGITGKKIGTTGRGIGPTYTDATARVGIRVMDLASKLRFSTMVAQYAVYNRELIEGLLRYYQIKPTAAEKTKIEQALTVDDIVRKYTDAWEKLKAFGIAAVDTSQTLDEADRAGKRILYEGAQATLLDITHGDYPFVTSSHPTVGGLFIGSGFRPRELTVIGVLKAYATRVGEGPFPTELTNRTGEILRERGHEYGTTTGRPRRCGWLDLVVGEYAVRINGVDGIAMTKLDILSGMKKLQLALAYRKGKVVMTRYPADQAVLEKVESQYVNMNGWRDDMTNKARAFSDLPKAAQKYVELVEEYLTVPVKYIGVGPGREELVRR